VLEGLLSKAFERLRERTMQDEFTSAAASIGPCVEL
jgi:hypothetical protein